MPEKNKSEYFIELEKISKKLEYSVAFLITHHFTKVAIVRVNGNGYVDPEEMKT